MKRGLMRNISTISRCATLYRDDKLESSGLNGCQTPYVPMICNNPGITQDRIAAQIHVNKSTVTRQLTVMEENGFVTRSRSESDKRAIEVFPTEKMLDELPAVRLVFKEWFDLLTDGFTEEELEKAEELLERLAKRAENIV